MWTEKVWELLPSGNSEGPLEPGVWGTEWEREENADLAAGKLGQND